MRKCQQLKGAMRSKAIVLSILCACLFAGAASSAEAAYPNPDMPKAKFKEKRWDKLHGVRAERRDDCRSAKISFRVPTDRIKPWRYDEHLAKWKKRLWKNIRRPSKCIPTDPRAAAKLALSKYGWSDQWYAIKYLVNKETGYTWNRCIHYPMAVNCGYNGSQACGLPQAKPCTKITSWCGVSSIGACSAFRQMMWMMQYIKARYGNPANAYAIYISRNPSWY